MPSLANFDGVKNSNGAVVSRGSNKQLQGEKENSCLGKRQLDVSREKQPHIIALGLQSDFIINLSDKAEFKTTSRWYQEILRRALFRPDGQDEDLGLTTKFLPSVILEDVRSNYVPGTLTRAYFLLLAGKFSL